MMLMLREDELVARIPDLVPARLHRWIRLGWVRPQRMEGLPVYQEVDVARVRLLRDLETGADLDEDTVVVILSLLDQIHGLRHELRSLVAAVDGQPLEIRERIRLSYHRIADAD